jgi:hypothetical protein
MSQLLEEGLFALLKADAAISALVGARVYPRRLPDGCVVPALTYSNVGGPRDGTHGGDAGLPRQRFQINCYADDYLTAKKVAKAVSDKLSGYRGACGTSGTIACDVENGPDGFDDVARRGFVPVDVIIQHQEGN